jgi:hypothetical protein
VVGLGSSFLITAFNIYKAGKSVLAFSVALNTARIAGGTLTLGMRALMVVLGPVGVALGVAAGAVYLLTKNSRAATAELDGLIGQVQRLRGLSGKAGVAGIRQNAAEIHKLGLEEKALLEQRRKLQADAVLKPATAAFHALVDAASDSTTGIDGVNARLAQVRANMELLRTSAVTASKRIIKESKEAAAAAKADAEQVDTFVSPTAKEDGSDEAAKNRAEAEAKAADLLAEKKRDIADRAAREILDIEKELSEARLSIDAVTQAQIDANTKERLSIIDTEIEKRKSELEGLLRDAERAGSTEGVSNAKAALAKLPELAQVQKARVEEDALVESIRLKEKGINDLIALRDGEIEAINTKVELGLLNETEGRQQVIDKQKEYQDQISTGIDALIAQLQAIPADSDLSTRLGVPKLIQDLQLAKMKAGELQTTVQLVGKNLGGQFASGLSTAMATFAKGLAGGIEGVHGLAGAFKAAKDAFLNFLADFLVGIGQAILQAIILEAIMAALEHRAPNYGGAAMGALTGHTGGVVKGDRIGKGNPVRQISPAIFAGAARFHEGGLPGLKPNEVPAILKKREEVLTEDDPRNVLNGGTAAAASPTVDVSIHNSIDSGSVVAAGINTRPGRKAIFNHIQADKEQYRRMLGIN